MVEEEKKVEAPNILFFCRECQKLVPEPQKVGNKYIYKCTACRSDNVAFGTRKSICNYFHIKDRELLEVFGEKKEATAVNK